jgi:hypothetical protein
MIRAGGDEVSVTITVEGGPSIGLDLAAARVLWSDLGRILNAADNIPNVAAVAVAAEEEEEEAEADAKWPE